MEYHCLDRFYLKTGIRLLMQSTIRGNLYLQKWRIMDGLNQRDRGIVSYVRNAKGQGVNDNCIVRLLILLLER